MDILLIINKADLKCMIFDKDLLVYNLSKLDTNYNVKIYTEESVKDEIKSRLIKAASPIDAINKFSEGKKSFIVIVRLALCNINFENLIKYHDNHDKKMTLVCKNFVHNKSIPIYKLNDKKEIISVTRKRFADTGIYLFKEGINFKAYKNVYAAILALIKMNQIKGYVHKGYWWVSRNIQRRGKKNEFKI